MGRMTDSNVALTVRDLRRRWKPFKEELQAARRDHPTAIRIHRCCSWMQRVETSESIHDDDALIYRWIALNSLYGRWNDERREPAPDRQTLSNFADRMLELDTDGRVVTVLHEHKRLVMSIMDDEFLAKHYWEEPGDDRARRSKKAVFDVRQCYLDNRFAPVLWRLLDRTYLLRCQIMHGAATAGGALNRTSLRRCNTMLGHLLPAILLIIIDHGKDEEWGTLCYPPH